MKETDFNDEHAGKGGSYVVDPVTGKRTLAERCGQHASDDPAAVPADASASVPAKAKKGVEQ